MKKGTLIKLDQQKELTSGKFEGAIIYNAFMDNGDEGEIFVAKGQTPPEVDKELEYDLQETDYGNKIKPKREFKGGGKGFGAKADPMKAASIERQSSLKAALDYCIMYANKTDWKPTPNDVLEVAKVFVDWVHQKPSEPKKTESSDKIKDEPLPTGDKPENKLPF